MKKYQILIRLIKYLLFIGVLILILKFSSTMVASPVALDKYCAVSYLLGA